MSKDIGYKRSIPFISTPETIDYVPIILCYISVIMCELQCDSFHLELRF